MINEQYIKDQINLENKLKEIEEKVKKNKDIIIKHLYQILPAYMELKSQRFKGKIINLDIGHENTRILASKHKDNTYHIDIPTSIIYDKDYIENTKKIMAEKKKIREQHKEKAKNKSEEQKLEDLMEEIKNLPKDKIQNIIDEMSL